MLSSNITIYDISLKKLDSIIHRLYEQVSDQIDCNQCANFCKEVRPILNRADIKNFSKGLGISTTEFQEKYLTKDEESSGFIFNEIPCPFLKDNLCSNYDNRPKDCRSFPHLHKKDFVFRLIGVIDNCAICPIVYNVFELLKDELWHDFDDFDMNEFY